MALAVTRYWALQMENELQKWAEYSGECGDLKPPGMDVLETWRAQKEILEEICPLDPVTPEALKVLSEK